MNSDDIMRAWQSQSSRVSAKDIDLLVEQLMRKQRQFDRQILFRDIREAGVSLLLIPVWLWMGLHFALPMSWYLTIPALVWIAAFTAVDRWLQRRHPVKPTATMRETLEHSHAQVAHQIWLLRNVHWWYLMPLGLSMSVYLGKDLANEPAVTLFVLGLIALTFTAIYWINQLAVKKDLLPRQEEIASLLRPLDQEESDSQSSK